MRITSLFEQYLAVFTADYECEFCGHVYRGTGYNDSYFHQEIIPAKKCSECGKSSGVASSSPSVPEGVVM